MIKPVYQSKPLYPKLLWQRPVHYYKSEAGKVLVLAGSKNMTGAAILVCEAVFRSGTGIMLLGFPESLKAIYRDILPEAMTLPLPETPAKTLSKRGEKLILEQAQACDSVIIGPGLSQNAETIHLIWQLVFDIKKPIILDADGINALANGIETIRAKEGLNFLKDYFRNRVCPLVITPHPGEALRLISAIKPKELRNEKVTAQAIDNDKPKYAMILSEQLNALVVLKGYQTVIAKSPDNLIINQTGGPELATAGTGDVLAGIIGSFVGQNPNLVLEACATGVYLHGLAGEIIKKSIGERSVIASDIIRYLPEAIKKSENEI